MTGRLRGFKPPATRYGSTGEPLRQTRGRDMRESVKVDFTAVYRSDGEVNYWCARVVGSPLQVFDRSTRQAEYVSMGLFCEVRPNRNSIGEWFTLVTQGYASGGRRYREFATFAEAVTAGERWASRRFAYLREGES